MDSTTIALVASCIDWAKHRRRKAAAKLHMRLDLQCFLPRIAIVEEASHHDNIRSVSLCAELKPGEIVVFDKAYVDFAHLFELTQRGVFWVTRAKDNMSFRVPAQTQGRFSQRTLCAIRSSSSKGQRATQPFPFFMRRVLARVEIDGKMQSVVFLTNNFD